MHRAMAALFVCVEDVETRIEPAEIVFFENCHPEPRKESDGTCDTHNAPLRDLLLLGPSAGANGSRSLAKTTLGMTILRRQHVRSRGKPKKAKAILLIKYSATFAYISAYLESNVFSS
jgi:hypothetical protein